MSQLHKSDMQYDDTTFTAHESSHDIPGSGDERKTVLMAKEASASEGDSQYLTTSSFLALLALSATYVGVYTPLLFVVLMLRTTKAPI